MRWQHGGKILRSRHLRGEWEAGVHNDAVHNENSARTRAVRVPLLKNLVKCGTLTALVLAEFSVKYPKNMRPDLYGEFYREHQSSISGSHPEYRLRAP